MDIDQIVILVKQKNKYAERQLFELLASRLMSLCKRYSKDDHEAKDYFQDCFIKVYSNLHKYKPSKGRFEPWFIRVCTNHILENKRKEKIKFDVFPDHFEVELEENDLERLTDQELLMAIRKLPQGYRDILNLFVFEKLSHKDIAQLLNIKESTSRSQYTRAKKMLKKLLIQSIPNIYERQLV